MNEQVKPQWKKWSGRVVLLLLLVLTFVARFHNRTQIFHDKGVFFLDGDCYSRMTRAKMVSEGHWIIRHHDFENWPLGVTPHTTALLDWMIAGLKPAVDLAFTIADPRETSVYHKQSLDVAGALISPLLGVLTAAWLWWWCARLHLPFRGAVVLLFALSPIAVHGTVLGRPDHQSLLLLLLAVAFGCELRLVRPEAGAKGISRAWRITTGCAWGFALWVSLYEPLVLLGPVLVARVFFERKNLFARGRRAEWIAMTLIFLVGILVDGRRIEMPGADLHESFVRWSGTIGELRHLSPAEPLLWQWLGLLFVATPILLCLEGRHDRRAFAVLVGVVVLFGLTVWQRRWGYFLLLAFAMSLPWQLHVFRKPWLARSVFALGLVPIIMAWSRMAGDLPSLLALYPFHWAYFLILGAAMCLPWQVAAIRQMRLAWIAFASSRLAWIAFALGLWPIALASLHALRPRGGEVEKMAEDQAWRQLSQARLRTIALKMKDGPRAGFIAPWWMSPQIAYWSGQPGIAGSSHQSLPGTIDAARFYLSTDPAEAEKIVRRRQVGWVIADDASFDFEQRERLLAVTNSEKLLGVRAAEEPLAFILAQQPRKAPPFLREVKPKELGLVMELTPKDTADPQSRGIQIIATQMHRLFRVEFEKP